MTARPKVDDRSGWEPLSNYKVAKEAGIVATGIKISEGNDFFSSVAADQVLDAQVNGIPVFLYHFLEPVVDPIAQANWFFHCSKIVMGAEVYSVPVCMDVEGNGHNSLHARTFIRKVEELFHYKPFVYTNAGTWSSMGNPSWGAKYPLWVANYPYTYWDSTIIDRCNQLADDGDFPTMPKTWEDAGISPLMWQFSAKAPGAEYGAYGWDGSSTELDINFWMASEEKFIEVFGNQLDIEPEPPVEPEPCKLPEGLVLTQGLSIRTEPRVAGSTWKGSHNKGDVVMVIETLVDGNNEWWLIFNPRKVMAGWSAAVYNTTTHMERLE